MQLKLLVVTNYQKRKTLSLKSINIKKVPKLLPHFLDRVELNAYYKLIPSFLFPPSAFCPVALACVALSKSVGRSAALCPLPSPTDTMALKQDMILVLLSSTLANRIFFSCDLEECGVFEKRQ
ncbi:MAG: hypothetical protein ACRC11_18060 [Xenococcaceae cyanobacterium]